MFRIINYRQVQNELLGVCDQRKEGSTRGDGKTIHIESRKIEKKMLRIHVPPLVKERSFRDIAPDQQVF